MADLAGTWKLLDKHDDAVQLLTESEQLTYTGDYGY